MRRALSCVLLCLTGCGVIPEHWYLHTEERPHTAHWGYEGDIGPEHWADLDPSYMLARTGKQQSPVNIDMGGARPSGMEPIDFHYQIESATFVNNGHTLQHDGETNGYMVVEGTRYDLKQFHLHTPSEHTIDGRHYDMEVHLVHQTRKGRVAVVAVLVTAKSGAVDLQEFSGELPWSGEVRLQGEVDPTKFLPADRSYFH